MLLVCLPPAALLAWFVGLVGRGVEWRRGLLWTALGGGVFVWGVTEGLSLAGALGRWPLAAAWTAAAIPGAALAWKGRRLRFGIRSLARSERLLTGTAALACGAILTGAAASAVWGAPNMIDVLNYHLPRVFYWLQHGTVAFYPTSFYQHLSLQPFSEYSMLQLYALAGGDRFASMAQWAAFAGAIVAASLLAERLGAGVRGQAAAAIACATLPNAALQASGGKPDITMGFWLLTAACFVFPRGKGFSSKDAAGLGLATGLALFTKGTAYAFGPGLAAGALLGLSGGQRLALLRRSWLIIGLAAAINAPLAFRNWQYNGHPLGDGTASGGEGGVFANERFDAGVTISNALRNAALQMTLRNAWNERIHSAIVKAHERMGLDHNDPATTFGGAKFEPTMVSRHEALAANVRHLLLLGLAAGWLVWRRRWDRTAALTLGCLAAFVLFCALLKWQPWHSRMHTPLFLLASAPIGIFLERVRPRALLPLALIWLIWNVRAPLLDNWLRPLHGERNVFITDRMDQYFVDLPWFRTAFLLVADRVAQSGCERVGIDTRGFASEYGVLARIRRRNPRAAIEQVGVANPSARYEDVQVFDKPCAVICLHCADLPERYKDYDWLGTPARFNRVLLFPASPRP